MAAKTRRLLWAGLPSFAGRRISAVSSQQTRALDAPGGVVVRMTVVVREWPLFFVIASTMARKQILCQCQRLVLGVTLLNVHLIDPSACHSAVGPQSSLHMKPQPHAKIALRNSLFAASPTSGSKRFLFGNPLRKVQNLSMSSVRKEEDAQSSLTVATWNVNSINKRLPSVLRYLQEQAPDVVALQEIKCQNFQFPADALAEAGYHSASHGQKSYNGVALLSREPLQDVKIGLELESLDGGSDANDTEESESEEGGEEGTEPSGGEQARYIEATVRGLRVCNLYLPNGNPVDTDKFTYRQQWTERLLARTDALLRSEVPFVLLGDFNLVPSDHDMYSPTALKGDAVIHPACRHRIRALKYKGLYDALETVHNGDTRGVYTYWGYRGGAWERGNGIRIDHVMLEAAVADRLQGAGVHAHVRGWDTPSDHAPVWTRVRWGQ